MSTPLRTLASTNDAVPSADTFPLWPVGWYTVARSRDIEKRPYALELNDSEVVLFRTESGRLHAIGAHCPHMGTHLRYGKVVGEQLQCPMHHWRVDGDGFAEGREGCASSRAFAVSEAHGLVFVYLGGVPRAPAPAPENADRYTWLSGGPLTIATSWHHLMVSGFDMQHLLAVHHRRLIEPAEATWLDDGRLRLRYVSEVRGGTLPDRVMSRLGRTGIEVIMTCSGPIFVVESRMGKLHTCSILGLLTRQEGVAAFGSFGVEGKGLVARLRARVARWLYLSFLKKDFAIIEGMRLKTHADDVGVASMSRFLASLPEVSDV